MQVYDSFMESSDTISGIMDAGATMVRAASNTAVECEGGCGFYAVENINRNLCSKCYKDYCLLHPEPEVVPRLPSDPAPPAEEEPKQKDKTRCYSCNKKVGLLGFKCRSNYLEYPRI